MPFLIIDKENGQPLDPQPEWKTTRGEPSELVWTGEEVKGEDGELYRDMGPSPLATDGEYLFVLARYKKHGQGSQIHKVCLEQYEVDAAKKTIDLIESFELLTSEGKPLSEMSQIS